MYRYLLTLCLVSAVALLGLTPLSAQDEADEVGLMHPTYQYSKQKTSYITLTNGKEIVGNVKDFDRKRGMIDYIKIKDESGKVHKLDAKQIKFGYFHPSAASKFASINDKLRVQDWDKDLNEDHFGNGYVYLEQTKVQLSKKKTVSLLLQLLNPHFSNGIRIYYNPFTSKTAGVGVGPLTLAGDNAKSYYVKKTGDRVATLLHKSQYKKQFDDFYGSCSVVTDMEKIRWQDLAKHAYLYGTQCAK